MKRRKTQTYRSPTLTVFVFKQTQVGENATKTKHKMTPKDQIRTWTREVGNAIYIYSTDPSLVDLAALNAALASDTVWWGRGMPEESLKRMVEHSYNFGLYVTEKKEGDNEKEQGKKISGKHTHTHTHPHT